MMDWYDGGHMTGAGWVFMTLTTVLVLALLFAIGYLIVRAAQRPPSHHNDTAQRVLDERFARGEIDAEEYQLRRALLEGERRP